MRTAHPTTCPIFHSKNDANQNSTDQNPIRRWRPPLTDLWMRNAPDSSTRSVGGFCFCPQKKPMHSLQTLKQKIGESVVIRGWIQAIRSQKRMQFVILRTAALRVQCVVDSQRRARQGERIADLIRESTVKIKGLVVENEQVELGGTEIRLDALEQLSHPDAALPIDLSSPTISGPEPRLDWRFLDLRQPESRLIFEIQTEAEWAMRQYWRAHQFVEIHTPKLIATTSESGAELFEVGYFGDRAYLGQPPQLYKQMAMAAGFDRVFEVAPVFRANPSFTSRHDTEFTCVDVEISWIDSHEDVMQFEERWLQHVLTHIEETFGEQISKMFGVDLSVPSITFPRVTMARALEILAERSRGHHRGTA